MLDGCGGDPDEVLAVLPPRFGEATPPHGRRQRGAGRMPARVHARCSSPRRARSAAPRLNLRGVNATTHPVAPLLIVHGEIAEPRAATTAASVRSVPGNRANATDGSRAAARAAARRRCRPGSRRCVDAGRPGEVRVLRRREHRRRRRGRSYHRSRRRRRAERRHRALRREPAQLPRHGVRPPDPHPRQGRVGHGDARPEQRPASRRASTSSALCPEHAATLRVGADGRAAMCRATCSTNGADAGSRFPRAVRPRSPGPRGCTAWPTMTCCR